MQLITFYILVLLLVLGERVKAQLQSALPAQDSKQASSSRENITLELYEKPDWKTIDIDFLSSYYSQDGNHAAVTGGIGTEHLTDFTQKVIVRLPMTPQTKINFDAGYDYYSSASTDNIDNIRASASLHDMRVHGNMGLTHDLNQQSSLGIRLGASSEYDYTSLNGGLNYAWLSSDQNTSIGIGAQAFFDTWELYYPRELRRRGRLVPTDKRKSLNASFSISHVINRKMQVSLQMEATYMDGLLSTPFHRVYFEDQNLPRVESLPQSRLKIPVGLRLNTYHAEWLISRLYYRYYRDDWGIQGHTASLELPVKFNRFMSLYPSYRYHTQSGADYFKPYKSHLTSDVFYTSDYDLAELDSHSLGLGFSFSPVDGIMKTKVPFTAHGSILLESIDVKYAYYSRSTDLKAHIVSLGLSFKIR